MSYDDWRTSEPDSSARGEAPPHDDEDEDDDHDDDAEIDDTTDTYGWGV